RRSARPSWPASPSSGPPSPSCTACRSSCPSAPARISPFDQLRQQAEIPLRAADAHDEVGHADVEVAVEVGQGVLADAADRALDLGRVAADPAAPVVEDVALLLRPLRVSEAVPDVGVLGDDAQGDALAAAA